MLLEKLNAKGQGYMTSQLSIMKKTSTLQSNKKIEQNRRRELYFALIWKPRARLHTLEMHSP